MSALTSPPSCLVHDIFWDSRAASSWPKVTLLRRHVNHTGSCVVMFRHHHTGSFLYKCKSEFYDMEILVAWILFGKHTDLKHSMFLF
jgi:hypothetical protein